METLFLNLSNEEANHIKLAKGLVIYDTAPGGGKVKVMLNEPPEQVLSIEQQKRIVRLALDCKINGDWKAFAGISDEILLQQLNLPEDGPAPGCSAESAKMPEGGME